MVATDVNGEGVAAVAAEIDGLGIACDISDESAVVSMFEKVLYKNW